MSDTVKAIVPCPECRSLYFDTTIPMHFQYGCEGEMTDPLTGGLADEGHTGAKMIELTDPFPDYWAAYELAVAIGLRSLLPELDDNEVAEQLAWCVAAAVHGKLDMHQIAGQMSLGEFGRTVSNQNTRGRTDDIP